MNTYKTLAEARAKAAGNDKVVSIIEIDHATDGRVFTLWATTMDFLKTVLKKKPMPEILKLIKEYDPMTPEAIAELKARLREVERPEREYREHKKKVYGAMMGD